MDQQKKEALTPAPRFLSIDDGKYTRLNLNRDGNVVCGAYVGVVLLLLLPPSPSLILLNANGFYKKNAHQFR